MRRDPALGRSRRGMKRSWGRLLLCARVCAKPLVLGNVSPATTACHLILPVETLRLVGRCSVSNASRLRGSRTGPRIQLCATSKPALVITGLWSATNANNVSTAPWSHGDAGPCPFNPASLWCLPWCSACSRCSINACGLDEWGRKLCIGFIGSGKAPGAGDEG